MGEESRVAQVGSCTSTSGSKQEAKDGRGGAGARTSPAKASSAAAIGHGLEPGSKVGRYQIVRMVGQGGMGTVYEGFDTRLNRKVALKILASSLKGKRKAAKRFSIEAQAAARLVHPNVVGIFDFEVECETPYMAMEFLDGETLASVIARGPLSVVRVANIMLAVCAGVEAAHQAGIIHRDLKPSNIFLCADWKGRETARVLDFGISKVGGISSSGLTQTGDIVGTSQYLSPEQASGIRNVNALSDQYALGVVMYECLTQRTPQQGEPMYNLLRNVTAGCHVMAHRLRTDLSPAFESIIERAMRVRPDERFPSVRALGQALFPFAAAETQREFDDFYRRCDPAAQAVACVDLQAPASQPLVFPSKTVTSPLPRQHEHAWQSQATRTSARPAGKSRRSRPSSRQVARQSPRGWGRQPRHSMAHDGAGRPAKGASARGQPGQRSHRLLWLLAMGVLAAIATMVVLGLGPVAHLF